MRGKLVLVGLLILALLVGAALAEAGTSLFEFCGYDLPALEGVSLIAYWDDCEAGASELELSEAQRAEIVERLTHSYVTGKQTDMLTTGETTTYCFVNTEGETLARFTFFGDLLVMPDGMYGVAPDENA